MASWLATSPDNDSPYSDVLTLLKARDVDAYTMAEAPTSPPVGAKRWNTTTKRFQEWTGAVWSDLDVTTGLALGTMASQNSNAVAITGGTIGGTTAIDATRLTSGLVATARLGAGTASQYQVLHGDQQWRQTPPVGTGALWFTAAPPTGWVILNGQLLNRITYSDLFALWGITFGAGDGVTTFKIPDLRGFFPFGKAAAGTGSVLGTTFGVVDHFHVGAAHTHLAGTLLGPSHFHSGPSHSHTLPNQGTFPSSSGQVAVQSGSGAFATPEHFHNSNAWSTDPGGTGNTGNSGTGAVTGSTGAASAVNTATENPPGWPVNFIVRAL